MANTVKKEKPAPRDREARGEVIAGDEFDDELTKPVLSADDPRDGPVRVRGAPLTPGYVAGDHFDDELTAPVLVESDADDRVDDDPHEEPVAVPGPPSPDTPGEDRPLEPSFVLRDRFEIIELVHTGGMSRVYKAIDRRRHPPDSEQSFVAIKMLRPSALPGHDAPEMLEREAAAAQHLSHPNIVNVFDFDTHDEHFFLVMEWLQGKSVKEILQRTTGQHLAPEFAWQIIHGVANALEHAHSNEVVHADINLSNIFVTDTKQVKLLDFGVSRRAGDAQAAADDKLIWVTHKYASPDVLSGSVPVFADDIFALGCVAYRLLSGRHPFAGVSSLEAKESGLVVDPVPGLPARQWQVLKRALALTRADRPTSVSEFLDQQPAWPSDVMRRVQDVPRTAWLVALPVAAVVVAAGLWSLLTTGPTEEAVAVTQRAVVADPAVGDASSPAAELDERLQQAAQAMADERYVLPEGRNARQLYAEVLGSDPDNPVAADGLRKISDIFVQQAGSALSAGNLSETAAALAIAADTDPANPAIAVMNELLTAQADAQRAPVAQEAAEGNLSTASAPESDVDRDQLVEAQEPSEAPQLSAASSEEQQLVEGIARAEEYIAARRLTLPADDSAYRLLLELRERYGNDDRLLATMNRLGDALLIEAAIAAAARDDAEAARLLGMAESVSADPGEIERIGRVLAINAREALQAQSAAAAPAPEQQTAPKSTEAETAPARMEELTAASADEEDTEIKPLPVETENLGADSADIERSRQPPAAELPDRQMTSTAAAASTGPVPAPSTDTSGVPAGSDAPATNAPAQPKYVSLSDMKIEKYVAPVYPRAARRRGLTGSVEINFSIRADGSTGNIEVLSSRPGDIFVSSATKAVSKWRFEPPGEVVTAQVNIRFDEE